MSDLEQAAVAAVPSAPALTGDAAIAAAVEAMRAGTSEPAAPVVETPAPVVVETAPPPAAEPPGTATKLADALTRLAKREAEVLALKTASEKATARATELEATIAAAQGDPNKLLELGKLGAEALGKLFLENKLTFEGGQAVKKADLPPEVQEAVEYAQRMRAKEASDAAERASAETWASSVANVKTSLETVKAEFPVLASLPGAAERLTESITFLTNRDGAEPDFRTVAANAEKAVRAELQALVSSESAIRTMLGDPAARATLAKLLAEVDPASAVSTPAAPAALSGIKAVVAPAAPPATLSGKLASAVPSRTPTAQSDAEIAALIEGMKRA